MAGTKTFEQQRSTKGVPRTFKTSYFAKQAKDAGVRDSELWRAAAELQDGQGDSLGAGIWKKRLDKNRQRAIVLTRADVFWVYVYLFAKKDRENITPKAFRQLPVSRYRPDAEERRLA